MSLKLSSQNLSSSSTGRSSPPCRLSWFIVQQDETRALSIIHAVNLQVTESLNEIYINGRVNYRRDGATLSGTVLFASDNQDHIEKEFQRCLTSSPESGVGSTNSTADVATASDTLHSHDEISADINPKNNWFLVQCIRDSEPNRISHSIVHKNQIDWDSYASFPQRQVVLIGNEGTDSAKVLYVSNDEEEILEQIKLLTRKTTNSVFRDPDEITKPWLLIQYGLTAKNVVYAVINEDETVWQDENKYKDIVTYWKDGSIIYQSIILKRSLNREEIKMDLELIKANTLLESFPINEQLTNECNQLVNN